jgi:hypothetical protein
MNRETSQEEEKKKHTKCVPLAISKCPKQHDLRAQHNEQHFDTFAGMTMLQFHHETQVPGNQATVFNYIYLFYCIIPVITS